MDNLVRTPVLEFLLVGCSNRERRCLHRQVCSLRLFGLYFEVLKLSLVLSFLFHNVRIDDFVFLFHVKRFKFVGSSNCFDCIVTSMLSLVNRMNTLWIVIPDMLVNHLSSPRSSHVMLIILHKIH
jgi:hypothetical protein